MNTFTKRDLIDLAVEYGMIRSTPDFEDRSAKAQDAILKQMTSIALTLSWG